MNEFKDLPASCVFIHIFAFAIFIAVFFLDSDRLFVSSAAEPKQRVKGLIHGRFCAARARVHVDDDDDDKSF